MQLFLSAGRIKVVLVVLLVFLGVVSFLYNQYLIDAIQVKERQSVELWAKAIEFNSNPLHVQFSTKMLTAVSQLHQIPEVPDHIIQLLEEAEAGRSSVDFVTEELIIDNRFNIPTIVVDESGFLVANRFVFEDKLDALEAEEQELLRSLQQPGANTSRITDRLTAINAEYQQIERDMENLVPKFAALNNPITIEIGDENFSLKQYVYYGESPTLQYLRFFPYIQFGLFAVLLGIGYTSYNTIRRSEQSNLWVGMAKEAAHQLGTPLSSMYGWIQLLKEMKSGDTEAENIIHELENDINRLKGIAERFNKIGSEPELKLMRIEPIIDQVTTYMKRRVPQLGKNVDVRSEINTNVKVKLNAELFQWAIENLIKNSMDAIKQTSENAFVAIVVDVIDDQLVIDIKDSGMGIDKKHIEDIFKPGFSTKKRGWGLGLSLTKRIIEDYHKGRLIVLRSEPNEGTTMRITLNINQA
jgi:signal transduction histidine kinase